MKGKANNYEKLMRSASLHLLTNVRTYVTKPVVHYFDQKGPFTYYVTRLGGGGVGEFVTVCYVGEGGV